MIFLNDSINVCYFFPLLKVKIIRGLWVDEKYIFEELYIDNCG